MDECEPLTVGGVRAYYTLGSQRLEEVARDQGLDAKDMVAWNKPALPGLTTRAYLLAGAYTRPHFGST